MSPAEITAIVLAAGISSRMGQNKLLMEYRGEPMIMACLRTVLSCGFRENILVISEDTLGAIDVPREFAAVVNKEPQAGQGSSVAMGAGMASHDSGGLMFFQADMPLLDKSTILTLTDSFDGMRIAVPFVKGEPRSPAIFPAPLRGGLAGLSGDTGGRALFADYPELILKIPYNNSAVFRDIDTAADYKLMKDA